MSGITSFTATQADSALDFAWVVDSSNIDSTNIRKITIVTNDYGYDQNNSSTSVTRHNIVPAVVGGNIVVNATISGLTPGIEYGAVLLIKVLNGGTYTTYSRSLDTGSGSIKVLSVPIQPQITASTSDKIIAIFVTNYISGSTLSQAAIGYDPLSKIYVYLSNAENKSFVVHSFDPANIHNVSKILNDIDHNILNETEYEIAIQTENSIGLSQMSNTITKTPRDTPDTIADMIAVPRVVFDGSNLLQNVVAFGNTSDSPTPLATGYPGGPKPITSYTIYRYLADGSGNATGSSTVVSAFTYADGDLDASGLSTSSPVTYNGTTYPFIYYDSSASGIVAGTRYVYSIIAENDNGSSPENFMPFMTTGKLASAPVLTLTPSDGQIIAAITAPSLNGFDASSNKYRYTFYVDGSSTPLAEIYSNSLSVTDSSLNNGTTYRVTVEAITVYDSQDYYGLASEALSTPYTQPDAPTGLDVSAVAIGLPLDGKLNLTWNAVTNLGGSTGDLTYTVLVDGSAVATGISGTSYQVTGLTNGTSYSITVKAVVVNTELSVNVESLDSTAVNGTPFKLPSDASNLELTRVSSSSLTLTYNLTNDSGLLNTAARTYITVYNLSTNTSFNAFENNGTGVTDRTLTVTGLTVGDNYRFSVKTGISYSVDSTTYYNADSTYQTINGTAYAEPDAPVVSATIPTDGGFRVDWTTPADIGTSISGYEIYVDGSFVVTVSNTYYTLSGLTNGTTYSITVKTIASVDYYVLPDTSNTITSSFSSAINVIPQEPPGQPSVTHSGTDQKATLTWVPISGATGYEVSFNGVTYDSNSDPSYFTITGSLVTFKLTGLTNGTSYAYDVWAYKVSGWTDNYYSTADSDTVVPTAVAAAPTDLDCVVDSNEIATSWTGSISTVPTGADGMYYRLVIDASYSDGGVEYTQNVFDVLNVTSPHTIIDSQLVNGGRYLVTVYAYFIANGQTYQSVGTTVAVVVNPKPQEVSSLTVVPGNHQNTLTWSNPTDSANYTRTGIEIYRKTNGSYSLITTLSTSATTYTDSSLTNGTEYTYKVRSVPTTQASSVVGVEASGIPFGKPIYSSHTPALTSGPANAIQVTFDPNGSPLGDYVAIGATPTGNILVKQGTSSSTSNTSYDTISLDFTGSNGPNPIEALLISVQNAAGITTVTIPIGNATVFGQA